MSNGDMIPGDLTESIVRAIEQQQAIPPMPAGLSMDQAYEIQQQVTSQLCKQTGIAGIKAGLTSGPVQQYFGIDDAVIGSLYGTGRLSPGCQIESTSGLMLECEIGVIIGSDKKPVSLVPVIEVVFLKYSEPSDLNAVNIVAANVGADRFICGEPLPWDSNCGSTDLLLTKDGETVCQASTGDSLEGPAKGLAWMMQESRSRQFDVKEGMLFILGTCGPPVQADKGEYLANYGELGNITFTVS
ncbi:MAG: hypothetical protein V7459_00090 [Oceanicoccus sp.]